MKKFNRRRMTGALGIGQANNEIRSVETKDSLLKTILIPLGSLLVAALGLIVRDVPRWVTAAIIVYIVVVAVAVLIAPARESWKWLKQKKSAYELARKFHPQLQQMVNILLPQIEESRTGTIFHVWNSIGSWGVAQGHVRPDQSHQRTLYIWLSYVGRRLEVGNRSQFAENTSEIGELIIQYTRVCEQAHRELDSLATTDALTPQQLRSMKQDWNQVRDKHNQTVKGWEDIAKNINKAVGEEICFDHYSQLKTIE